MRETQKMPRGIRRPAGSRFWWIRYHVNGRRYEESTKSTDLAVAKRLLRMREGDAAKGVPVNPKVGRLTLDEGLRAVVTDYSMNGRDTTADLQRRIDKHLVPYFRGHTRMTSITTPIVTAFVVSRQQAGASNGEINRELAALKRAFTLAVRAGLLMSKPHIPMLAEAAPRSGFFERDQYEEVRKHLPPVLARVTTFAYFTGWRVKSEVLTLQWRQVDFDGGLVRLDAGSTKNDEPRRYPFSEVTELRELLEAQREETKRVERERGVIVPWVFHRAGGKPIRSFLSAWRSACRAAGCPDRIPHDLRRTAVRNLTRAGVPEQVAMKLTGHKTRSVFDRYDVTAESDLKAAVARLEGATGIKPGKSASRARVRQMPRSQTRRIS